MHRWSPTRPARFPPGLVTNLFRGFDVCISDHGADAARLFAVLVAGASPAIAAAILLNSMDAETLRARQAEQQESSWRLRRRSVLTRRLPPGWREALAGGFSRGHSRRVGGGGRRWASAV